MAGVMEAGAIGSTKVRERRTIERIITRSRKRSTWRCTAPNFDGGGEARGKTRMVGRRGAGGFYVVGDQIG